MSIKHLTQYDLAKRWAMSPRSLERWRWMGKGPHFLKIGGKCVYALADIEAYEAARRRASTAETATARAQAAEASAR
jgi:hypothetical protein